jgi:hypothetical protein
MRFKFHGLSAADFDAGSKAKAGGRRWPRRLPAARKAERTRAGAPLRAVDAGLYDAILNRCVDAGKMCMHEMMAIDAAAACGQAAAAAAGASRFAQICSAAPTRARPTAAPAPNGNASNESDARPDLTKLLFGRLSWEAIPLHEPILLVTFAGRRLGGACCWAR